MAKYKIQFTPESKPFTVATQEAVKKWVALYRRLRAVDVRFFPYIEYPVDITKPIYDMRRPNPRPLPICIVLEGNKDSKSSVRGTLRFSLEAAARIEAYKRGEVYEGSGSLQYEAEAEEYLRKVEEYRALPEEDTVEKNGVRYTSAARTTEEDL